MPETSWDALVVGGGFFGALLATHLGRRGSRVLLAEKGPRLIGRASLLNQARVHQGYHYPRSYLTGLRSRVNASIFRANYPGSVVDSFDHYYAIGRTYSKVSSAQFIRFCERIGAPVTPAPDEVNALFNPTFIEQVVKVEEAVFDADRLREQVLKDLEAANVEVIVDTEVIRVQRGEPGTLAVLMRREGGDSEENAARVFNCTYSRLNAIHSASGLPLIPLKHELTEMALVEPPAEMKNRGVTVMCGPFFSMLPYPTRGLHTLSHVRYTPHESWQEGADCPAADGDRRLAAHGASAFPRMVRDAARYLPCMASTRRTDSLWEVKTVLPRSEVDDSRPILFSTNHGLPGYHCVIGSKLDNAFDMLDHAAAAPDASESSE